MKLMDKLWGHFIAFREKRPRLSAWLGRYGIYLIVLFFILLYSMISLLKHMNWASHGWDLGIFDQYIWQLSRFQLGYNTVRLVPSLLGDHFHLILFFMAPSLWIWNDVRMLLIVQAVVVALGAIPVFYVVRHALKSNFCAICMALVYLFFWGTMELIFFDIHELAFAGPILALSYLFIQREKWVGFFLTIPFLLMIKETMAFVVIFLGLYVMIAKKKWWEGATVSVIALGWFYVVTQKMMPALASGSSYYYFKYYSDLGPNFTKAGIYLITHPWKIVTLTFIPFHKTKLLFYLFVPFLFIPLLGLFAIVAIAPLYEHLLSNYYPHWEILRHYNAIFAPIFIFACIEAFPRIHRWLIKRGRQMDYRKMVFALCIAILVMQIPFTLSRSTKTLFDPNFYSLDPKMERTGYDVISMIPKDASVCAQDPIVPHLTHRDFIYQYDGNTYNAEYVVINKFLDCYPFTNTVLVYELDKLYKDPRYVAHHFGYGWVLFTIKPEFDIEGKLQPLPEAI
jgi:uncharacterized membrane protein